MAVAPLSEMSDAALVVAIGRWRNDALAEVYRRGGVWRLRAVGQGYHSGLASLATSFGVSVEDD